MIREGHEVGSHTYTHPNLATVGKTQTLFELNATQRLFEAFTGRTLKLFRAPFFGDAEPTTADEILPAWEAQNRGYISVGLHVDSEDWQRPGVPAIINNVLSRIESAPPNCNDTSESQCSRNVVLLHDFGRRPQPDGRGAADPHRYAARARLPVRRRCRSLPGCRRARRCRRCRGRTISRRGSTLACSSCCRFLIKALGFLFAAAITLGIGRALVLTGLALRLGMEGARAAPGRRSIPRPSSACSFRRSTRSA